MNAIFILLNNDKSIIIIRMAINLLRMLFINVMH